MINQFLVINANVQCLLYPACNSFITNSFRTITIKKGILILLFLSRSCAADLDWADVFDVSDMIHLR